MRGNQCRAADVRAALLAARARTLALADDWQAALGPGLGIGYATEFNPPLWEWGHVAWFQEWWIARNRQAISCDLDALLEEIADATRQQVIERPARAPAG